MIYAYKPIGIVDRYEFKRYLESLISQNKINNCLDDISPALSDVIYNTIIDALTDNSLKWDINSPKTNYRLFRTELQLELFTITLSHITDNVPLKVIISKLLEKL